MWDTRVVTKMEKLVGRFSVSYKFTSVLDQFAWAFTGVYGPIYTEIGGFYGRKFVV